jgi:hypothetical protein
MLCQVGGAPRPVFKHSGAVLMCVTIKRSIRRGQQCLLSAPPPPPPTHTCLRLQVRSSHGVFLDRTSDPRGFLAWLEERIGAVTMIPPSHGEVRVCCCCWGVVRGQDSDSRGFPACLAGGDEAVSLTMMIPPQAIERCQCTVVVG